MTYRVFISYRRQDQVPLAQFIHSRLATELNVDEVFLDQRTLKAGEAFFEKIERAIEHAVVFIALIGTQWNPPLPTGGRRLDQADDAVRRELEYWFKYASADPAKRLLIPALFDRAVMPRAEDLPATVRPLTDIQAFFLADANYPQSVSELAEKVVTFVDSVEPAAPSEKWITEQLTRELQPLGDVRIRQLGADLRRKFQEVPVAPESARGLARAIYRVGSAAIEFLLGLGLPDEQMESLLKLLATNWIEPQSASELRSTFADAREGRIVALECIYPYFTPTEALLKASQWPKGWLPTLHVNPKDPANEIIQQIHDDLVSRLDLKSRTTTSMLRRDADSEKRIEREREEIRELLAKRSVDRRSFPYVLHVDHIMAADGDLISAIEAAFPQLHILVATGNVDELEQKLEFSAVVTPSADEKQERDAFEAYAEAHELIGGGKRTRA
jgi:hypothetical protein